jgi:hypothetical protein
VSYLIRSGTRVYWELVPSFNDPGPLTFQLQVGTTANNDADDWEDVGLPADDQYFAVDGEQRVFGKTNWAYYRVALETSRGSYLSDPVNLWGTLSRHDWRLAREITRKELVAHRGASQQGYLLKRRVTGQRCRTCLDFMTGESRNPACASCYGTGFECGYYYPMGCAWANMTPRTRRTELDGGQGRGTIADIVIQARMTLADLLGEDDIWVNKVTDDRYYIHRIQHVAEWRGVPLVGQVEMRPVAFSSAIYGIEIPQQLAYVEGD